MPFSVYAACVPSVSMDMMHVASHPSKKCESYNPPVGLKG